MEDLENKQTKILAEFREDVNISGTIKTEDEKQIMYMSCNINKDTFGSNINVIVYDKELYRNNAETVKEKYQEFKQMAEKRALELGNIIF